MKTEKISRGEAWVRLLDALRPIKEIRGEQVPKAFKDYPELTMSLSSNVGYLRFLIERTRRRIRAGYHPDIPGSDELDDILCAAVPEVICGFWQGDITKATELGQYLDTVIDLDDVHVFPPITTCEDLINQYREAVECFENIPDGLPPAEYIAAVENCQNQLEEIKQQIVDEGCICDLLYEEFQSAGECFENIPDGLSDSEYFEAVQICLEQLEDIQTRMEEWGCEY